MTKPRRASPGEELSKGAHVEICFRNAVVEAYVVEKHGCKGCVGMGQDSCVLAPACSSPSRIFASPQTYALLRLQGKA